MVKSKAVWITQYIHVCTENKVNTWTRFVCGIDEIKETYGPDSKQLFKIRPRWVYFKPHWKKSKKKRNNETWNTHRESRLMCACLFIIHFIFTYHSLLCARWNEALHLYKFWLVYMLPWQSWFTAFHVHNSKHNRRHIRKPHFFIPSTAFKYSIVLNFIYHVLKLYFIKKIVGIKRFLKLIFDFFVSFVSLCYDCMPMLTNAWLHTT